MSEEDLAYNEKDLQTIFVAEEVDSVEPPSEEWSSLNCLQQRIYLDAEEKLTRHETPIDEICANYLPLSDSSVFRHPYYNYPSIGDPGVEAALLEPQPLTTYPDDGQALYLALCEEMNIAPCRLFLTGLLNKHISLSYYGIRSMGFRAMALALRKNKYVESIDFTDNFISIDGCFHFGEMLVENSTLKEMNFKGCQMGPEGIKNLVAYRRKNYTLKIINLAGNKLMDQGVGYLADAIYRGAAITDIDLSYNSLTPNSLQKLCTGLGVNNVLTRLNLSWNTLGTMPKSFEEFAKVLAENEQFTEIDLSWNSLSSRLAKALRTILLIPNLKVFNVSNNNLSDVAISEICACLPYSKNLDTLDLSFNPISVPDAKMLLSYMSSRKVKLKNLFLDEVYVDHQFVAAREQIMSLKFRKNAVITYGYVYKQDNVPAPDMRSLVLTRAQVVCTLSLSRTKSVDFAMIILELNNRFNGASVSGNDLKSLIAESGAHNIDSDLVDEMVKAFPGPKKGKVKTCKLSAMADFVKRLWPDKKLPEISQKEPQQPVSADKAKKKTNRK